VLAEQPVQARHTNVIHAVDGIAHNLRCNGRLFGNREIGRAGGSDHDDAAALRCRMCFERDAAGGFMEMRVGQHGGHGAVSVCGGPRYQQVLAGVGQRTRNDGDLVGRLALSEHDFGKSLADVAVMIDAGESQILKGFLAQELKELLVGCLRRGSAGLHRVKQGAQLLAIHRAKWLKGFDFALSWTITSSIGFFERFICLCRR
jgi:hypothetical protein